VPIDASVPIRRGSRDEPRSRYLLEALDYIGIAQGRRLTDIAVARVFIALRVTNSLIDDRGRGLPVLAGLTSRSGLVGPPRVADRASGVAEGTRPYLSRLAWSLNGESGCSMGVA